MSIQGNVNQLLSVAGMLYTQTAGYEERKGRETYFRGLKRKEEKEKRLGKVRGEGWDTELEWSPETTEALDAYTQYGGRELRRRAERAFTSDPQLFPDYRDNPEEWVRQMGVEIPSTGANRRTIRELSRATGMSRGQSATYLRQIHETRGPAMTAPQTTPHEEEPTNG